MRAVIISLLVLLSGCTNPAGYKKDIILMGTFVRIEIADNLPGDSKEKAVSRAIEKMRELEKHFNYYLPTSELTRINKLKKREMLSLSQEMFKVLKTSRDISGMSGGAFSVSMGDLDSWVLDEKKKAIVFKKEGVKIDLGGIAKGFIVDEGISVLRKNGISNALVAAGGDLYCMGGGPGGNGWKIGIRSPEDSRKIVAAFTTRDKGVATSGDYERPSHIIDPRTTRPVEKKSRSVTVVANDCMTADALATALYVLGPEDGLSLIEGIRGAECVIIGEDGEPHISSGFGQINLTKFRL